MNKTSETPENNDRPSAAPLPQQFCQWFWHHSKKAHGVEHQGDVATELAGRGLFQYFAARPSLSEDEAIHRIWQDRDGALSLAGATVCEAGIEEWDLTSLG